MANRLMLDRRNAELLESRVRIWKGSKAKLKRLNASEAAVY